jgi:hypothetical protein
MNPERKDVMPVYRDSFCPLTKEKCRMDCEWLITDSFDTTLCALTKLALKK